ncbi:hypothetical protein [Nonomuraea gerenzanensis]|uniref:Uncharacterized protein n=1 Tax=Nonomuraea gerenzanensis TaxID=93944 RepID=A0A1M4EQV5_9ACTN|nr:hypothetical protein [Nonomuraea gerenzanensis]UBU12669.1 hypothetical protein LCN96_51840 [Nonomuraea gerenzanensis]SBP01226.1 hypothetical protein BN4615_P10742 [Nonomuraea gerenzanensis]
MLRYRLGPIVVALLAVLVAASGAVALVTGDTRLSVLLVYGRFPEQLDEVDTAHLVMLVLVGLAQVWALGQILPKPAAVLPQRHGGGARGGARGWDERLLRIVLYAWIGCELADRLPSWPELPEHLAQAAAVVLFFRVMRPVALGLRLVALVVGLLEPVRVLVSAIPWIEGAVLYDVLRLGGVSWLVWLVLTVAAQAKDGRWRRGTLWAGAVVAAEPLLVPELDFPFFWSYAWFEGARLLIDVVLVVWLGRSAREAGNEPKALAQARTGSKAPSAAAHRRPLRWWPAQAVAVVVPLVPAMVNCVNGVFTWIGPRGAIASWFSGDGWFLRQLWLPIDVLLGAGGASGLVLAAVLLQTRRLVLGTVGVLLVAAVVGVVSAVTTGDEGERAAQASETAIWNTPFPATAPTTAPATSLAADPATEPASEPTPAPTTGPTTDPTAAPTTGLASDAAAAPTTDPATHPATGLAGDAAAPPTTAPTPDAGTSGSEQVIVGLVRPFESRLTFHDESPPILFDELLTTEPGISPLWYSAAFTTSALLLLLAYGGHRVRRPYRTVMASVATAAALAFVPVSDQEPARFTTAAGCDGMDPDRVSGEQRFVCSVRRIESPPFGKDMPDERLIAYGRRLCDVYTRGDAQEAAAFGAAHGFAPLEQAALVRDICPKAEADVAQASAEDEAEMLAWEAEEQAMCDRAPRHRPLVEPVRATREKEPVWPEVWLEAYEGDGMPDDGLYGQELDLVAVAPGHLLIEVETTYRVCVTTETYDRRPPVETKGWAHVVEVGYESPTGTIELTDNLAGVELPDLSLRGRKGHYRIRVHYDPPDWERKVGQRLLVMAWPGRGDARVVHRAPPR